MDQHLDRHEPEVQEEEHPAEPRDLDRQARNRSQ
jgi:hypothetical protein